MNAQNNTRRLIQFQSRINWR